MHCYTKEKATNHKCVKGGLNHHVLNHQQFIMHMHLQLRVIDQLKSQRDLFYTQLAEVKNAILTKIFCFLFLSAASPWGL